MIDTILFALWFFAPAGVANVTPILIAKIPFFDTFNRPLDFGKTFHGKRVLGEHKTMRTFVGIVTGTLSGMLLGHPIILGLLLSVGALGGDLAKSFFKRQMRIASGKPWFPFDQLDYIVGGIATSMLYVQLSVEQYIYIVIVWFLIHVFSTGIGYLLRLKTNPL